MTGAGLHETLSALIQTALAPVFLLSANASTLIVIDTRQNRIVDRLRALEAQAPGPGDSEARIAREAAFYVARARRVGWAAVACIVSALGIALAVVALFVDAQVAVSLSPLVEGTFTCAVLAYVAALAIYLRDVLAVNDGLMFTEAAIDRRLTARRGGEP